VVRAGLCLSEPGFVSLVNRLLQQPALTDDHQRWNRVMKLVVGLGNPGGKYEDTRHNAGFAVAGELARRWSYEKARRRFNGLLADGSIRGERVLLLEPTTYMNLSGVAVREASTFFKIDLEDLLVVSDDMALPLGRIRLRARGSAGGHNGLASIVQELGSEAWARLRVGIGQVSGERMVGHVLGTFSAEERPAIQQAIQTGTDAVECWVAEGIDAAMTKFNRTTDAD
jgi:peptidyl-tRNA hydrolase, PTH1 family